MAKENLTSYQLTKPPSISDITEFNPTSSSNKNQRAAQDRCVFEVRLTKRVLLFLNCFHGFTQLASRPEKHVTKRYITCRGSLNGPDSPSRFISKVLRKMCLNSAECIEEELASQVKSFASEPSCGKMLVIYISKTRTVIIDRCIMLADIRPVESELEEHKSGDDRIREKVEMAWSSWMVCRSEALESENRMVSARFDGDEGTICCVCLNEFEQGGKVARTSCCHYFHKTCISNWVCKKLQCPFCRNPIDIRKTTN